MTDRSTLSAVYAGDGGEATRALYDDWAARYEVENRAMGYRVPEVAAGWLARHPGTSAGAVLDAGCGTGLVGETLAILGIGPLTGLDLSGAMLAAARARGVYAATVEHRLGEPLPFAEDTFAACGCFGSFGPGHAPPEALAEFVRVVRPGGVVAFNLREDTFGAQGFPAVMDRLSATGAWIERGRSPAFRPFTLAEPELLTRLFAFEVR